MTLPIAIRGAVLVTAVYGLLGLSSTPAEEIRAAVASNFADAAREIAGRFERRTGHEVTLVFGSTGKHYAQLTNGAPFDVFLAADAKHPARLEERGLALPGTRFTYAIGKVVLWSPRPGYVDGAGEVLETGDFRFLAVSNPRLAPYGVAAREVLEARGLSESLRSRMVQGENVGQTFQFVQSGNAELGFVAWSQIRRPGLAASGSWWEVPQSLYSPIEQQAVVVRDKASARAFVDYVRGDEAREIIVAFGYAVP